MAKPDQLKVDVQVTTTDLSKDSSSSISPDSTPSLKDLSTSVTSQSSNDEGSDPKLVTEDFLDETRRKLEEVEQLLNEKEDRKKTNLVDTYGNEFELPDFSFNQLRKAIPSHCFKRSAVKSLGYTLRDIVQWATLFWVFKTFNTPTYVPSDFVRGALWFVYTVVAGWIGTGLWVISHECGHGAFSDYRKLNDTVGWLIHSSLGVPYFSWQISHRKHHQNTGNLDRDMVFNPPTREIYASRLGLAAHELAELVEETPIFTALTLIGQQLIGWNMYLCTNATGHDKHENAPNGRGKGKRNGPFRGVNHFQPSSPIFDDKDMKLIYLSDIGLLIAASIMTLLVRTYGSWNMFVWYGAPYLWVNNWLVWITFLQHTDPTLPHYEPGSWNFVRGAAATIDRDFGFIGRYFMHGIVETHVVHHYFSNMPFYNAEEATEAIKPIMGRHYRANTTNGIWGFLSAMWTSKRHCQWVEPCEGAEGEAKGVYFYRNQNKHGLPPAKLPVPPKSAADEKACLAQKLAVS